MPSPPVPPVSPVFSPETVLSHAINAQQSSSDLPLIDPMMPSQPPRIYASFYLQHAEE
jgi:hypothetical protein